VRKASFCSCSELKDSNRKTTPISQKDIPRPHMPTCRPSELSLLTMHPQELARQLTLIEAKLFCAIKPWELLNLAWSRFGLLENFCTSDLWCLCCRKDKEQKAPNVLAMISRSNSLTPWISSQV